MLNYGRTGSNRFALELYKVMTPKHINPDTLRAIHEIFECGLALTDVIYTDEQIEEICTTFDEMYYEFMNKCK